MSSLADAAKIANHTTWTRCRTCGAVLNEWYADDCAHKQQWMASDSARTMVALDGDYAATRYFERHVCGNFDELDPAEIGPEIARRITALIAQETKDG